MRETKSSESAVFPFTDLSIDIRLMIVEAAVNELKPLIVTVARPRTGPVPRAWKVTVDEAQAQQLTDLLSFSQTCHFIHRNVMGRLFGNITLCLEAGMYPRFPHWPIEFPPSLLKRMPGIEGVKFEDPGDEDSYGLGFFMIDVNFLVRAMVSTGLCATKPIPLDEFDDYTSGFVSLVHRIIEPHFNLWKHRLVVPPQEPCLTKFYYATNAAFAAREISKRRESVPGTYSQQPSWRLDRSGLANFQNPSVNNVYVTRMGFECPLLLLGLIAAVYPEAI